MKKFVSVLLLVAVCLSSISFTAFAAEEVYITAADSECTRTGAGWGESTNPGCLGPNKENTWYTTSKDDYITYSASKLEKGKYGVYVYHLIFGNTASTWDITITASGKAETVKIDAASAEQTKHSWVYLGNYEFDGNANDAVKMQISKDATVGCMRSVAVKFIKDDANTSAPQIIGETTKTPVATETIKEEAPAINNADGIYITATDAACTKVGTWAESSNPGCLGPNKENTWYTTSKEDYVTYSASGIEKGNYGVYTYLLVFGNTAKTVDTTITASGNASSLKIDANEGGQGNHHWVYLGNYDFDGNENDSVKFQISQDAGAGCMRTVAVKFVKDDKNSDTPAGESITVEVPTIELTDLNEVGALAVNNATPGAKKDDNWQKSGLMTPQGITYYSSVQGATGLWPVNIKPAKNVEVSVWGLRAGETEDAAAEYEIYANGKSTKVTVDFRPEGNKYYSLGKYDFAGDGTEYVKLTKTTSTGVTRLTWIMLTSEGGAGSSSAFAGTDLHILERMGMLIGEGDGITEEYIKTVPTRVQAAIMVLRLNGVDAEAAAFTGTDNFADASLEAWAMPYLAYLKAHPEFGLEGTGNNMFEPTAKIDEQSYAKILLTALGYKINEDFTWDGTLAFAKEKGIASATSGSFNVNDLAIMTTSALKLNCKNGTSLLRKLVEERDGIKADGVIGTQLTPELLAARTEAKNKKRFIYNNDGNDVYQGYPEYPGPFNASGLDGTTINKDNFLKPRSYGLENTQVTTVFYGTGVFNSYTQLSDVTDIRMRDWSPRLKEFTGKDSLETMTDFVHSIDKEIFWSMRMNDTHDYNGDESHLTPWKQEHIDYIMYRKNDVAKMIYGDNRWSAVDFTIPEVRQHVYNILEDVITRYDVDGLELDLTRWPLYFKEVTRGEKIYPENIERMNNLIRAVRDLTEKVSIERGKPILLAIYVPDSMGANYEIGLDVKTWLNEGLIDIVSIGGSPDENQVGGALPAFYQSYKNAIAEYDAYDVPVYIVMDELGYIQDAHDEFKEAALMYEAGADGIYLYNYFKVGDEIFKKLGTAETTGPVDPNYVSAVRKQNNKLFKDAVKYLNFN